MTSHHPHHPAHSAAAPRSWATLALLAVAQFMVILDVTVVNVALPSIGDSLRFTEGRLPWVVTAYVLFTGALMLLGGRLADLAGRRRVFLAGLALFTSASLGSALAWDPASLIVARALQGTGAAMLLPSGLSIVTTTYEGAQRTRALGVWGALGSAGAAAGVLFGGILTDAFGWRSVFFVNVPVGIAVGALTLRVVASDRGSGLRGARLDLAGAAALVAGLVALILAIEGTSDHGWASARTLGLAAFAAALLAAFAAVERRARRPLIPPSTWRVRSLVSSAAVFMVATGLLVGAFFLNTLYLQHVMGASPLETGLAFLPLTLVILAGAHAASHVLSRIGSRPVVAAGLLVAAAGAALLAGAPADPDYAGDLLPGYLALGFGVGMTFVAVSVAAMAEVTHEGAGLASGLMTTAHEIGAALGVSVLAAIVAGGDTGSIAGLVDGYRSAFLVAGGVAAAVAVVAGLALPSVRPRPGMAHAMH